MSGPSVNPYPKSHLPYLYYYKVPYCTMFSLISITCYHLCKQFFISYRTWNRACFWDSLKSSYPWFYGILSFSHYCIWLYIYIGGASKLTFQLQHFGFRLIRLALLIITSLRNNLFYVAFMILVSYAHKIYNLNPIPK